MVAGTKFDFDGVEVYALNDGHATAWGHAMYPDFAGKRVATIALGTGVGCGVVDRGEVLMSAGGDYPRLNDLTLGGKSFEELLGGGAVASSHPPATLQSLIPVQTHQHFRLLPVCLYCMFLIHPCALLFSCALAQSIGRADGGGAASGRPGCGDSQKHHGVECTATETLLSTPLSPRTINGHHEMATMLHAPQ